MLLRSNGYLEICFGENDKIFFPIIRVYRFDFVLRFVKVNNNKEKVAWCKKSEQYPIKLCSSSNNFTAKLLPQFVRIWGWFKSLATKAFMDKITLFLETSCSSVRVVWMLVKTHKILLFFFYLSCISVILKSLRSRTHLEGY